MTLAPAGELHQHTVEPLSAGFSVRLWLPRIAGSLLAVAMACAFYGVIRLSWADYLAHRESASQVQAALKVAPGNAGYWLHWADMLEAEGRSGRAGVERAAQVDPYDASVWIRAGIEAESRGDYALAEQNLLRAAGRSRHYAPRWALANYYFRRGDAAHFWPWAQSAMGMAYGSLDLLFDLCWRMRPDAAEILHRGIPDNPKVLRNYLLFLLNTHRSDAAAAVAERLSAQASRQDRDLLLGYVGAMLEQHRWPEAISVWNALCVRKIVPYAPLDPARGPLVTNGTFATEPLDTGFDWRLLPAEGIAIAHSDTPPSLRFDFDGHQPQGAPLLYQLVPVEPLRRYTLRFEYRTEGIAEGTGLEWRVANAADGADIPLERTSLSSEEWAHATRTFTVPAGVSMVQVLLTYDRQPGTVRIEGTLRLKSVSLEMQP